MGPDRMEPDSVGVDGQSDADIRAILETTRRIALVGEIGRAHV